MLKVGNPSTSVLSCRLGFRLRRWVSSSHRSLVLCEQVTSAGGLRISRHHVPLRLDGYGQSGRFSVDFFHIRNKCNGPNDATSDRALIKVYVKMRVRRPILVSEE